MANTYSASAQGQSSMIKKIFFQIELEKNKNEFNRANVVDRTEFFGETRKRYAHDINLSGDVRIIDKNVANNYLDKIKEQNKIHIKKVMNGIEDPTKDLVHLQVKGKNQLIKEIEEILPLEQKLMDYDALKKIPQNEEVIKMHTDKK